MLIVFSLSVCLSVSLSISLYVYSVYDFYNNNNNNYGPWPDRGFKWPCVANCHLFSLSLLVLLLLLLLLLLFISINNSYTVTDALYTGRVTNAKTKDYLLTYLLTHRKLILKSSLTTEWTSCQLHFSVRLPNNDHRIALESEAR